MRNCIKGWQHWERLRSTGLLCADIFDCVFTSFQALQNLGLSHILSVYLKGLDYERREWCAELQELRYQAAWRNMQWGLCASAGWEKWTFQSTALPQGSFSDSETAHLIAFSYLWILTCWFFLFNIFHRQYGLTSYLRYSRQLPQRSLNYILFFLEIREIITPDASILKK